MEKKLEILKLSIPAISELSARKLLGGDGYGLEEEPTYDRCDTMRFWEIK